jgi:hypothetical protein
MIHALPPAIKVGSSRFGILAFSIFMLYTKQAGNFTLPVA